MTCSPYRTGAVPAVMSTMLSRRDNTVITPFSNPGGPAHDRHRPTPSPSTAPAPHRRRWLVLAVLCASVFVVVLDGTIINVALPTLATELGAVDQPAAVDRRRLRPRVRRPADGRRQPRRPLRPQGPDADRPGPVRRVLRPRRLSDSPGELIGWRAAMGIGAALMFPATLAILVNVFTGPEGAGHGDRRVGGHRRRRRGPRPGHRRLPARALLVGLGADDQRAGHRRRARRHRPASCRPPGTRRSSASTRSARWPRSPASARWCGP